MTVRPGQYNLFSGPSQANGGATGRTVNIGNPSWAVLVAVHIAYTASATVGNRLVSMRILDAAGNRLWLCNQSANVTAGQAAEVCAGAGVPFTATGAAFTMPIPVEMAIPTNAQIQVFDAAAVDNADTQQINAVYAL